MEFNKNKSHDMYLHYRQIYVIECWRVQQIKQLNNLMMKQTTIFNEFDEF